jgi:hypothetical protein
MRRKILQDFANVFCQRYVDLPGDLALLAYLRTGVITLNIITGKCSYEGLRIPSLQTCKENRSWLINRAEKHHISVDELKSVSMVIRFRAKDLVYKKSFGQVHRDAYFQLRCCSEIQTDEKSYRGQYEGEKRWGYDNEYHGLPEGWRLRYLAFLRIVCAIGRGVGLISKVLPDR